MKERITYLLPDGEEGINPATVQVTADSLTLPGIRAAKEWRITFDRTQLPNELQNVLHGSQGLHIRWVSDKFSESVTPLAAQISPGLHVFYTKDETHPTVLCPILKDLFGLTLHCERNSFTKLHAPVADEVTAEKDRTATHQYYHKLSSASHLLRILPKLFCLGQTNTCLDHFSDLSDLEGASKLDFDFSASTDVVSISALWPPAHREETVSKRSAQDRVEVGILNQEISKDDDQVSMGGFLTVLGQDDQPKATLFSFPSRHRQMYSPKSAHFTAAFRLPSGLHPTLDLSLFSSDAEPPEPSCRLYTYLTLPSTLFVDQYQLSDKLFLESQNLAALTSLIGESDLEAPVWVTQKWGSTALLELLPLDSVSSSRQVASDLPGDHLFESTVGIPLHLRYLPPIDHTFGNASTDGIPHGSRRVDIPYPIVFWACPAEQESKLSVNPFDKINLGYDRLFSPDTTFWHIPPANTSELPSQPRNLVVSLHAPVLELGGTRYVETGTGIVVLLGFLWVCWSLSAGIRRSASASVIPPEKKNR